MYWDDDSAAGRNKPLVYSQVCLEIMARTFVPVDDVLESSHHFVRSVIEITLLESADPSYT